MSIKVHRVIEHSHGSVIMTLISINFYYCGKNHNRNSKIIRHENVSIVMRENMDRLGGA